MFKMEHHSQEVEFMLKHKEDEEVQQHVEDEYNRGVVATKEEQSEHMTEQHALVEFVEIGLMVHKREDGEVVSTI